MNVRSGVSLKSFRLGMKLVQLTVLSDASFTNSPWIKRKLEIVVLIGDNQNHAVTVLCRSTLCYKD